MNTLTNLFARVTEPERQQNRPLGAFSNYVVGVMPQLLDSLLNADSKDLRSFCTETGELISALVPRNDPVSLMDQKMMYRALVRLSILYPDYQDIAILRDTLEKKIETVLPDGAILGPTYEDIILNNPAADTRTFTSGETGHYEASFYRGHQAIENHLAQAIDGITQVLQNPHREKSNSILQAAQQAVTAVRQSMTSFYKDLPREQFMTFKAYFDTNPFRNEKGPSGAFSAKIQHLIILVHGGNTPQDRRDYIDANQSYFPVVDLAKLRQSQKDNQSLKALASAGFVDSELVDSIDMTVLGFLQSHRSTVTKQMGLAAHGSAEQGQAGEFLSNRIQTYKDAMQKIPSGIKEFSP